MVIYGADKLGVDGHTHRQTDAGNHNTRRPKLASGNKTWNLRVTNRCLLWLNAQHSCACLIKVEGVPFGGVMCIARVILVQNIIQNYSPVMQKTTLIYFGHKSRNKANLRDLIAVTSLVILLKFDPNHQFFSPCDLEI